jgi:hypothetical protein
MKLGYYILLYSADFSYEKKAALNNISSSRNNCSYALIMQVQSRPLSSMLMNDGVKRWLAQIYNFPQLCCTVVR